MSSGSPLGSPRRAIQRGEVDGCQSTAQDANQHEPTITPSCAKNLRRLRNHHHQNIASLTTEWQQRPETPALISRIHTSSSHHTHHQRSDSAEEWIIPGSNHPPAHNQFLHFRRACKTDIRNWEGGQVIPSPALPQSIKQQEKTNSSRNHLILLILSVGL